MAKRWNAWIWAGIAAGVTVAMRLPSLNLLLDRDEGEFATLAWLWREGRGLPYRDYLEQKPPLTLLPHALAQAWFGDAVAGLRWLSLATVMATALAIYLLLLELARRGRLGRRLGGDAPMRTRFAGLGALLAGVLLSSSSTQALGANTETWQTLPLVGALAVLFLRPPEQRRPFHYFCSGFLIALGSLFKQPLLAGVVILPWAALEGRGNFYRTVGWTALGALVPWAAATAVFATQGAALDFLNCTWAYNQDYVAQGQSDAWRRLLGLAYGLAPELGAVAVLAALGWMGLGEEGVSRRPFAAWLGLGVVNLVASGHYYPHYAILLLAPIGALAAWGLMDALWPQAGRWSGMWPTQGRNLGRVPRLLRLTLLGCLALGYGRTHLGLWMHPGPEARTFQLYGVDTFVTAPQAARRIQTLCRSDQRLFIWGNEPELYFLSRRQPASRFLFVYPFTGEAPAWPDGDEELMAGLFDKRTGAAALSQGLDETQSTQQRVLQGLTETFQEERSLPGWVLGARKQ